MVFCNHMNRNRIFLFTISLMLTLLTTTILTTNNQIANNQIVNNQITFINDESSTKGFDTQIPRESYIYYEDTTGFAYGVYVSGNYAYVADGPNGLAVINISDPTDPGVPVYENTDGNASSVYLSGDYAYVADYNEGLVVIQIQKRVNMVDSIAI